MENLTAGLAIIGLVNGFRLLKEGMDSSPKNYWGFAFFLLAMAAGMLFGFIHWFGLATVEAGFLAGLASSGLYRVGEKVSGK
jgi:hypothetical protein